MKLLSDNTKYVQICIDNAFTLAKQHRRFIERKDMLSRMRTRLKNTSSTEAIFHLENGRTPITIKLVKTQETKNTTPPKYRIEEYGKNKNSPISVLEIQWSPPGNVSEWIFTIEAAHPKNDTRGTQKFMGSQNWDIFEVLKKYNVLNHIHRVNEQMDPFYPTLDERRVIHEVSNRLENLINSGLFYDLSGPIDFLVKAHGTIRPSNPELKHLNIEWYYQDSVHEDKLLLRVKTNNKKIWEIAVTNRNDEIGSARLSVYDKNGLHMDHVPRTNIDAVFQQLHGYDILNEIDRIVLEENKKNTKVEEPTANWSKLVQQAHMLINSQKRKSDIHLERDTLEALFSKVLGPDYDRHVFEKIVEYHTVLNAQRDALRNLLDGHILQEQAYKEALKNAIRQCMNNCRYVLEAQQFEAMFGNMDKDIGEKHELSRSDCMSL